MALYDVFRKTMVQLSTKKMPKTQYRVEHLFGLSCAILTMEGVKYSRKVYTIDKNTLVQ